MNLELDDLQAIKLMAYIEKLKLKDNNQFMQELYTQLSKSIEYDMEDDECPVCCSNKYIILDQTLYDNREWYHEKRQCMDCKTIWTNCYEMKLEAKEDIIVEAI